MKKWIGCTILIICMLAGLQAAAGWPGDAEITALSYFYELTGVEYFWDENTGRYGAGESVSAGSPTAHAVIQAFLRYQDRIRLAAGGENRTYIYSGDGQVLPSMYSKNRYLKDRRAVVSFQRGKEHSALYLIHELSHALTWVLYHDQKILYQEGFFQHSDVFQKYTEAVAITLANTVARELGWDYYDNAQRGFYLLEKEKVYFEEPIVYGAFPFAYTGGKATILRSFSSDIASYYRENFGK